MQPKTPTTGPITVGEAIKSLRLQLGLSQQAFATKIDASINSIARYEGGTNKPGQERLGRCLNLALESDLKELADFFQRELMVDCYTAFQHATRKLSAYIGMTYGYLKEFKETGPSLTPLQAGLIKSMEMSIGVLMSESANMGQKQHGDIDAVLGSEDDD